MLKGWPPFEPFVHFWSLAVEEQFYLVWPWVVLVSTRRTLRLVCLGIVVGSLGLRAALTTNGQPLAAFVLTPARMDALALGGLIAVIARESEGLSRLARWAWPTVMASVVLLGLIFMSRHTLGPTRDPVVQTIGFTLLAILSAGTLVIALAAPSGSATGRFFAHRVLRFLGRYSYGLYVFHVPVIRFAALLFGVGSTPRLAGSHLADQVAFTVATAAVSLAAALVSWHLFEAPMLRLKALFPYVARQADSSGR
jgi:peptidoglycan/LPS O-acetylase OafA/YrhL